MGEYINKWKLAHFQNAFSESSMMKKTLFIVVMSGMINQEVQKPQNEASLS
jgi:hypothetical protein